MVEFRLPDVMMARAALRLRAMADAIERGMTMTDVAVQFGVPIRTFRRMTVPKPRNTPRRRVEAISRVTLARAIKRIREGARPRDVACELNVAVTTLLETLRKRGIMLRTIKPNGLDLALDLYRQGLTLAAIREQTGIGTTTLYAHLRASDDVELRQARKIRTEAGRTRERQLARAIELYRQGVKLADIEDQTGIARATLYAHMRKAGIDEPRRRVIPWSPTHS